MQRHPRKSLKGFFSVDGREMRHEEVVRMVNYAVEKGYETEADIPENEYGNFLFQKGA